MAKEFLDAFEDSLNDAQDGLATKDDLQTEVRTLQERLLRDAAEREARTARQQQVLIGLVSAGFLTLIAIGVAILLAVLL